MENNEIIEIEISSKMKEILNLFNNYNGFMNRVKEFDQINFITSLNILNKESQIINSKDIEVIVSTVLYLGIIDDKLLLSRLNDNYIKHKEIHIIFVSWLDFISLEKEIKRTEYVGEDIFRENYKLICYNMGYNTFFKNLLSIKKYKSDEEIKYSNYLGLNPIIIFKGLHWGNIIYLFKIYGYTVHGGSITRRHKLSMTELRLAEFLNLIEIMQEKNTYYSMYVDTILSSNKYEVGFYNYLKEMKDIESYSHLNPVILEYLKINNIIYYKIKLSDLDKEMLVLNKKLENINLNLNTYTNQLKVNPNQEILIMNQMKNLQNNLDLASSQKHKMIIRKKIIKLKESLEELRKRYKKNKQELKNLLILKNKILNELDTFNKEKENVSKIITTLNNNKSIINNKVL
jgi:hypothetical protein